MRSYGQYCGLARALEIVGDRWSLLIVRQLLIAPARYRDLLDGLPGIATNLLADRLRDLEVAGVLERRLAGAGSVVEYALTPWGAQLREPVESLLRWSVPLMIRGPEADAFRPEWLAVALPALLASRVTARRERAIALDVGGPPLHLRVSRSGIEVHPADDRPVEATLRGDAAYVLGLAAGALDLQTATNLGLVAVDGDDQVARSAFGA